jgi:hypothetical protein
MLLKAAGGMIKILAPEYGGAHEYTDDHRQGAMMYICKEIRKWTQYISWVWIHYFNCLIKLELTISWT